MDVIKNIRQKQVDMSVTEGLLPPVHNPEMLLIGCIDARLNISTDVGIPYGKALIYRNVAALISGTKGEDDLGHISEAAALEFAVNVMKIKDIVVMGHTDCGGIHACLHGAQGAKHIMEYLAPLKAVRNEVSAKGGDVVQMARAMEQAAVRQSIANLTTYNAVANAIAEKRLALHGWVISTATKRISEMDAKTGEFKLMA